MAVTVVEINDVGVRAWDASGQLLDSPGFALLDGSVVLGDAALRAARIKPRQLENGFWHDLGLDPLARPVAGAATRADLAYLHLAAVATELGAAADAVILAVPASFDRGQLSLLLGVAREAGLGVQGLVEMAVVASARPAPGRQLMHLELMLHEAVLTQLEQGRHLRRGEAARIERCGQLAFFAVWADALADSFVRNTRFDPMHAGETEQQLYDALPGVLAALDGADSAEVTLSSGGREFTVTTSAARLATAAEDLYRSLTRQISAAIRPGDALTLQVSDRMHGFPGLQAALAGLHDCTVVELPPGAAAQGALRHSGHILSSGESLAFVTSMPWQQQIASAQAPAGAAPPLAQPTHVLYRGRALALRTAPLVVGTAPSPDERGLVVGGDSDGVSRRHCTLTSNGSEVRVSDHSSHGTWVNEERVTAETAVHTGDILRVGSADQWLQLISVEEGDGA